jgi:heme/copper-type cytochrome/quinol oxidase subunit 2
VKKYVGHFTTRRGFVAATGFGLASLYLVWAGYGAAPLGLGGHDEHAESDAGDHGGGHGEAPAGPSREKFRRLVEAFVEEHKSADGSVQPRAHHGHGAGPIDVYLAAFNWGYAPSTLRLEAGASYRFRMMALDNAHGASIQLGRGARIVRLRPGVLVEQDLSFKQPGEYLLYCTVYCGLPHDRMQGRIIVTEGGGKA